MLLLQDAEVLAIHEAKVMAVKRRRRSGRRGWIWVLLDVQMP